MIASHLCHSPDTAKNHYHAAAEESDALKAHQLIAENLANMPTTVTSTPSGIDNINKNADDEDDENHTVPCVDSFLDSEEEDEEAEDEEEDIGDKV